MIIPRIMKSPFEPRVAPDQDLSVPLASSQPCHLPPTAGLATAYHERFRRELLGTVQIVMGSSTASDAVRTSEAVLRSLVPRVVDTLGSGGWGGLPCVPGRNASPLVAVPYLGYGSASCKVVLR